MALQPKKVKISKCTFRFLDSRGGFLGQDEDNTYEAFTQEVISENQYNLEFSETFTLNPATSLYTGDINKVISSDFRSASSFFFRQSDPLPVNILAIYPVFEASPNTTEA